MKNNNHGVLLLNVGEMDTEVLEAKETGKVGSLHSQ